MSAYSIDLFTKEVEDVIRSCPSESDALRLLKPLMQKLVTTPNSVPTGAFATRRDRFANNLIYRPQDRIFSVMGGNWAPGQTTPIHDHLTWAVVGAYDGEESRFTGGQMMAQISRLRGWSWSAREPIQRDA